ncbi:MAG: 50S ribosomal protein L25, partial [Patescibacteria group bacterium]
VEVSAKDFQKIFKSAGEHTLIDAITEQGEKLPVLISDVARHPITDEVLSIDFRAVRLDEKTRAKIPVELVGVAPATKSGFVVVRALEEIEVEALPHKLPHKIEVDISALENPGQSIHVSDIKFSDDVKVLDAPEAVLITVKEKTKEEEAPAPAGAAETTPVPEAGSPAAETPQTQAKTPPENTKT